MKEQRGVVSKQMIYLLFVCVTSLVAFSFLPQPGLAPFASSEVHFFDESAHGLKILPASCASSATYWHYAMPGTGDGYGMYVPSNGLEYGAYSASAAQYICVSNSSGSQIFVPAKSAAELNAFRATHPAGVSAY